MRTALRTALATALVAGVAATPVLAAGSAFAAGTAPGPTASATAPAAPVAAPEEKAAPTAKATSTPSAAETAPAAQPTDTTTATAAQGTLIRTETLLTGTIAKIYKTAVGTYRAELFRDGRPVGVLEAGNKAVAGQDNGEYFVLTGEGASHNWIGNSAATKPGYYRLADGTVLQVGERDGYYGLQLIDPATGAGRGYTYLRGGDRAVYFYGKAVVVLESSGSFAAFVPGQAEQAAPQRITTSEAIVLPPAKVLEGPFVLGKCTVTQEIRSSFGEGWLLVMTNDKEKGPWAVLKDPQHEVVSRVDRAHPADGANGLRIDGADTATPRLGQRTQGGDTPYRYNDFPALPKGCDEAAAPAPSASAPANSAQGGQTAVVPRGGVAAGAEFGAEEGSGALVAAGAGAASLAAAGLGFTVLRRRSAAARG
ncbi:hypothetical protein [Streptomyces sp. KL110A]|uniref:hypothetical protein n=1 Tax=Streptomyces sp. KL110A TaxID=3384221 RepID=UPI0038BEB61D